MKQPKIVCLCGSTKFKDKFEEWNKIMTLRGHIVLTVGFFGHQESKPLDERVKKELDELHLRKIDLADEVCILNVGGYIGESTRKEMKYARETNKPVKYLCDVIPGEEEL